MAHGGGAEDTTGVVAAAEAFVARSERLRSAAGVLRPAEAAADGRRWRAYLVGVSEVPAELYAEAKRALPPSMRLRAGQVYQPQSGRSEFRVYVEANADGSRIDGGGSPARALARAAWRAATADRQRAAASVAFALFLLFAALLREHWRGYRDPWHAAFGWAIGPAAATAVHH